ncbi:ubiquitin-protein ligase E3C [Lycorma delicatula]|uniref:ubiquitin-protein ligase E3C n=1 Tax=Lycorma delicatula TaxID=130591 RepID=UPI003F51A712
MYSFEGEFRTLPEQNLAGASRKEGRNELILRAHLERTKREESRQRQHSAVCIQSVVRSYLIRQKIHSEHRQQFDLIVKQLGNNVPNDSVFTLLIQKFLFFYGKKVDTSRLVWISRHVLRHHEELLVVLCQTDTTWKWRVRRLLFLNLEFLVSQSNSRELLATPLRLFEVFTSRESLEKSLTTEQTTLLLIQIFTHLVQKGYIDSVRRLLDEHTPPLLEPSSKPPTPLAGSLLNMIQRPIMLVNQTDDAYFNELVMVELCRNVLSCDMSEPVKWFLLPALSEFPHFPFPHLLNTLNVCSLPYTSNLLYSLLILERKMLFVSSSVLQDYLEVLAGLTCNLTSLNNHSNNDSDDGSDSDDESDNEISISKDEIKLLKECAELLNDDNIVNGLQQAVSLYKQIPIIQPISQICHNLLMSNKLAGYEYKLLFSLALRNDFLSELWKLIMSANRMSLFGNPTPLLTVLSRGLSMTPDETRRIVPLLATFCSLFSLFISTLHDAEFYNDDNACVSRLERMGFSVPMLVEMILRLKEVSLGLVELAFPESTPSVKDQYKTVIHSEAIPPANTPMWNHLFKACVSLLRQLYARDLRRPFCPDDHWISKSVQLSLDNPSDLALRRRGRLRQHYRLFHNLPSFTREELEEGVPLSTKEIRTLTILREVPFVVPFMERVQVFNNLILKDKLTHQNPTRHFLQEPNIQLYVRRNYLYEDAFNKLSPENEPELRLVMRVRMVSAVGLDEAGVDGGGIFRDFLSELLKTAFDPNRGFFKMTKDNLLYPNPYVQLLHPNFTQHYYFIGRILGKALYENLLVELPLAEFFLSKLVGRHNDVDVHHLASLDSVMYKNLLYLKNYEGNVADLGLDFTVVSDELGETNVEELKPNGNNIPVTSSNRIEYIHLVADYKLNRQIHSQCLAFKNGVANVIPLEWLQMFSNKEMQVLISGAQIPVDVQDLKQHTSYTGGYSPEHPTIILFWHVLEEFNDLQRRQLLKFVTSCSRPPLLGFKNLNPPFCILHAGTSERLPTASTCMNLLKLPEFHDEALLREKLLYAIQSNAGFELS